MWPCFQTARTRGWPRVLSVDSLAALALQRGFSLRNDQILDLPQTFRTISASSRQRATAEVSAFLLRLNLPLWSKRLRQGRDVASPDESGCVILTSVSADLSFRGDDLDDELPRSVSRSVPMRLRRIRARDASTWAPPAITAAGLGAPGIHSGLL
jgi:hypothetical protein